MADQPLREGLKAPAFNLKDQNAESHRLSGYLGQWVVLYFYPKDDTSGCTKQACGFRDMLQDYENLDATVLGVSPQDTDSKHKFAEKLRLTFPILADPEARTAIKYGVWQEKSMYGKTYMGVQRTTFLIDPKGKIAKRFDNVKVADHSEQVRQALFDLQSNLVASQS